MQNNVGHGTISRTHIYNIRLKKLIQIVIVLKSEKDTCQDRTIELRTVLSNLVHMSHCVFPFKSNTLIL